MADEEQTEPEAGKKSGKAFVLLGVVLLLAGAAGGFVGVQANLIPFLSAAADDGNKQPETDADSPDGKVVEPLPDVVFVDLGPMLISFETSQRPRHLRFHAQLEVPAQYEADIAGIKPRILDVLNGYLRAIDPTELQAPNVLVRLRGQMIRRVGIVAGEERIRDLLVTEFVLS